MSAALRVVLVDDHALVRSGVRAELLGDDGLAVVGEAGDVPEAVRVVQAERPDVVLLDVHLPGGGSGGGLVSGGSGGVGRVGGVEVLERCAGVLALGGAPVRFLALSVSDAADDVIAVIRAGARGYVTKSVAGAELRAAVHRVAGGDAVFSPRLAGFVLDAFGAAGSAPMPTDPTGGVPADSTDASDAAGADGAEAAGEVPDDELDRLSAREQQVMRLIARGYAYKEVGKELYISSRTVETHVSSVLRKLQLSSRHELTRWAAVRRLL